MLVTCPRCLTKYRLAEEILAGRRQLDLLCSRCEFTFVLPGSEVGSEAELEKQTEIPVADEQEAAGEAECELLEKVPENGSPAVCQDQAGAAVGGETRGPSFLLLLACLLVLALALTAGYLLWRGQVEELTGRLHLVEVCGRTVQEPSGNRRVELSGVVVNASRYPVLDLQLNGVLLDQAGRRRARATVVGEAAPARPEIPARAIRPGGRRQFRLICDDCPDEVRQYLVEISAVTVDTGAGMTKN